MMRFFSIFIFSLLGTSILFSQTYSHFEVITVAKDKSQDEILAMVKDMKPEGESSKSHLLANLMRFHQYQAVTYLVAEKGFNPSVALGSMEGILYNDEPSTNSEVRARPACESVTHFEENERASENLAMARFLVERGGRLNEFELRNLLYSNDLSVVKFLFEQNWFTDAKVLSEILSQAIESGNIDIVKYFVDERKLPVNWPYSERANHALIAAAKYPNLITYLIDKGANPNYVDKQSGPVLFRVAGSGCPESVRLLLEAGADPNQINKFGRDLISYLQQQHSLKNKKEIIKMIKDAQKQ